MKEKYKSRLSHPSTILRTDLSHAMMSSNTKFWSPSQNLWNMTKRSLKGDLRVWRSVLGSRRRADSRHICGPFWDPTQMCRVTFSSFTLCHVFQSSSSDELTNGFLCLAPEPIPHIVQRVLQFYTVERQQYNKPEVSASGEGRLKGPKVEDHQVTDKGDC